MHNRKTVRSFSYGSMARMLALAASSVVLTAAGLVPTIASAQEETVRFNVAAGSLASGLNAVASQSGLQIGFDSALVRGMQTAGLSGQFTAEEAIRHLLDGTGLSYSFSGPRTVVLTVPSGQSADVSGEESIGSGVIALDTVTVTGEKFSRDLSSTYTSVGVVTGEEIERDGLNTISQAVNRMANVRSFNSGSGNTSFAIRGLSAEGVTQPSRSSPVVSVVVDGVEQGIEATRRGSRGVWDVEQVEVLRGPQSTLQGRNSLAGSVVVKTKDPTWTPEFLVDGMVGNNDFLSGAFALSSPIIADQLAFRVSGQGWKETKDIHYADPAIASLGEDEFQEIRGKLLFTPEALPGLTGLFSISRTHDKPGWSFVSGPDFFARRFDDPTNSAAEYRDTYVNRYVADLSYELSPDWTVKSVTALADTDVRIASPEGFSFIRDDTREGKDVSQDLHLTYDPADGRFSGVAGIFAGRFTTDIDSHIDTTLLAPFGVPLINIQTLQAQNRTESIALYGDGRLKVGDRWTLMAGGRILRDKVSADYRGVALNLDETLATGLPAFGSLDENNAVSNTVFLPKAGVSFDVTPSQSVALTASRGYRAGFSEAVPGSTSINRIEPEYLWSYEVAYRSQWLEDRLQLNGNVFYYDYRDQQILTYNPNFPGQTVTANSAKSHAYGAELEARLLATPSIELFSSVGLLKTRFDEGVTADGLDLRGNEFPEAPTLTATIGGLYRHETGFFAGADVSYTDGFFSNGDLANSSGQFVDGFTLVNAQFGYETEWLTIAAFAKNLFDEDYLTSISAGGDLASIGDSRSFGLRVSGRF
jgi:iron complex outermembrane recepter protein